MLEIIRDILSGAGDIRNLIPAFTVLDIVDVVGSAILIYIMLSWIRKTRGWALFRGILLIVLVWAAAEVARLNMMSWFFRNIFSIGVLAAIVIFQPELRRALEKVGTASLFPSQLQRKDISNISEKTVDAIVGAASEMSKAKTGALICVEGLVALGEHEKTGIPLNSDISKQLLINIFEKNTPLHDGAVIIKNDKIAAATCYLPLSERTDIDKNLGTRHRAALGLSEVSDAIIVVVSEETGAISVVQDGKIKKDVTPGQLRKALYVSELKVADESTLERNEENEDSAKKEKKGFFRRHVFNNPLLKIASLFISAFLWLLFANIEDPLQLKSYEVPVEVRNIEKYAEQTRIIKIDGSHEYDDLKTTVYIEGRASEMNKLSELDATEIVGAYIDLYEFSPDDSNRLMIHYEMLDKNSGCEPYNIRNKTYYTVEIENFVTIELPVEYSISGSPANGYFLPMDNSDIQVTPKTITLSGPESKIGAASKAFVSVDVDGEKSNINRVSGFAVTDDSGKAIDCSSEAVSLSTSEVSVYIPVYVKKSLGIKPSISGEAKEGYMYANDISCDVSKVIVYGQESVLKNVSNIALPAIDLSTVEKTCRKSFKIQEVLDAAYGENAVRLDEGSSKNAVVTFSVEKVVEKTLTVSTEKIKVNGVQDGFTTSFPENEFNVVIYGKADDVEKFDGSSLVCTINLSEDDMANLGEGEYMVTLSGLGNVKAKECSVKMNLWTLWYPSEDEYDTSMSE